MFDSPEAYLACFIVGAIVSLLVRWKSLPLSSRCGLFILGQTIILTAPLFYFLDDFMYGSFPTIDKAGSMAFYLDGLHQRIMSNPIDAIQDPGARLIGVHVGHLWVTQLFDVGLTPVGAFNLQALLYPALAWWMACLLEF